MGNYWLDKIEEKQLQKGEFFVMEHNDLTSITMTAGGNTIRLSDKGFFINDKLIAEDLETFNYDI